jgi:hypothetical protein
MTTRAQADLTHLVTLMTRERYTNDADFRLRRCQASARYYVKKRLMSGKDVKSKYEPTEPEPEPDETFILPDNKEECPADAKI